jgi:hypothetical protein
LLCSGGENEEKLFNIKCREGISLDGLKRVGLKLFGELKVVTVFRKILGSFDEAKIELVT